MRKILIADDEKALRMLVVGTLEIGDYDIVEVDNGLDAVSKVKEDKPDLLVLDVMMPGMTGYEVCHFIKSNDEYKDIKVLILTAKGQQSDKNAARDVQADYYLSKPFSPAELLNIVDQMMDE